MKRLLLVLVMLTVLLTGCGTAPEEFEGGRVWLVAGGVEHKPHPHFVHSTTYSEGGLVSRSGVSFSLWLDKNLNYLSEIEYTPDIQVMFDGEHRQIDTWPPHWQSEYSTGSISVPISDELTRIVIFDESFVDGIADISIPDEPGRYLVCVVIHRRRGNKEFSVIRYVFKIVR